MHTAQSHTAGTWPSGVNPWLFSPQNVCWDEGELWVSYLTEVEVWVEVVKVEIWEDLGGAKAKPEVSLAQQSVQSL